jgi:hypothetical protein
MVSVTCALVRVKSEVGQWAEARLVERLCDQVGHRWRRGSLDPATTIQLFIIQILHGNTAINHLRHLTDVVFSASAYCQARMRLPVVLLQRLARSIGERLIDAPPGAAVGRWRGHRVWHVDGTAFSMPDEPALCKRFGYPPGQHEGCGFPVAKLLVLIDAATGIIARTIASPWRIHEMSDVALTHEALTRDAVLVADRGFCSYVHLALVLQRHLHAVFRMHQRTIVSFHCGRKHAGQYPKRSRAGRPTSKWLRRLGAADQLVTWIKPTKRPSWCIARQFDQLPSSITVRELRYDLKRRGFRTRKVTLVTTLTDAKAYPKDALAALYGQRWQVETRLRELKTTMGMDVLRCRTVEGVLKELAVFTLVYNLVRAVCQASAHHQNVEPTRVSFVDALRWLCALHWAIELEHLIVNPSRQHRLEPRVRKRRPKSYSLMTKPRQVLRQELAAKGDTT